MRVVEELSAVQVRFRELERRWMAIAGRALELLWRLRPQVMWALGAKPEFPEWTFGAVVGDVSTWYVLVGDQIERRYADVASVEASTVRGPVQLEEILRDVALTISKGLESAKRPIPPEDFLRIMMAGALGAYEDVSLSRVEKGESVITITIRSKGQEYYNIAPAAVGNLMSGDLGTWRAFVADLATIVEDARG